MIIGFFISLIFIFSSFFLYGLIFIFVLILVLYFLEGSSRRRLLPKVREETDNHKALRETGIRWLLRVSGRGVFLLDRAKVGLPRTIADQSMFDELRKIEVPKGLVEPETVRNSIPTSTIGSIFAVIASVFLLIMFVRITQSTAPSGTKTFAWIMIPVMSWFFLAGVLGVPVLQKSKVLPEFWRRIGRRQVFSRGYVAGPGWVKFGKIVWNANTDLLLIRRHSFRSSRAIIECMLVSRTHRRRITFSGLHDDDFLALFCNWNVSDVRLEFVNSELS
jgi:hypothetical protein